MSRIVLVALIATSLATVASAQIELPGRRDSVSAVRSGDIALAALLAPVRIEPIHATRVDDSGVGLSICAGSVGKWKCMLGGAALGFVAGALIGNALSPQEVTHTEERCGTEIFFGCSSHVVCDAHCHESVTKTWVFGLGGGVLGGVGGYYLAKASNR